jgi:hypothetical protein
MDRFKAICRCAARAGQGRARMMGTKEHYLFRAASLREIQRSMVDPLARVALNALIQALEEAAAEVEEIEGERLHRR